MSIPEEMIMRHLDMLLSSSDPGDSLHHLHVVSAPADAIGPFGLPDEEQLEVSVYAIAADDTVDAEQFVARTIAAAGIEHAQKGDVILFAALGQELWTVETLDDEFRRLRKEGRLFDHPDMAEATVVYGACRDGRRWRGRRYLTGPKAGMTEDVDLLVGRPHRQEAFGLAGAAIVRRLVGIG